MATIQDALAAYHAKDFFAARRQCADLAADGDPDARYLLGVMTSFGEGGPVNPAEAATYYFLAADAGHPAARHSLAALYAKGRGVRQDFGEAMRWYTLAAQSGDVDALYMLGVMHAKGEGVVPNPAEARAWWERAAAFGHPHAMHALGRLLSDDRSGVGYDPGTAAYWFFKAWQRGEKTASKDLDQIRADLELAAGGGYAVAQNALGMVLMFAEDHPAGAAEWFERAAEQGHPESLRMLAYLCSTGRGVPRDDVRAAGLYHQAAERGDIFAQYNVALMFARGWGGLPQDIDQAIDWYRKAADRGLRESLWPLAEALAERNRDRLDAKEAIQRVMAVAAAGNPAKEYKLGAGDGTWGVTVRHGGSVVNLIGLTVDELQSAQPHDAATTA